MLRLPMAERIEFNQRSHMLFINFEGLAVESMRTSPRSRAKSRAASRRSARASTSSSTTTTSSIRPDLMDAYAAMVKRLAERYYARVTRYAASGFVKARLEYIG